MAVKSQPNNSFTTAGIIIGIVDGPVDNIMIAKSEISKRNAKTVGIELPGAYRFRMRAGETSLFMKLAKDLEKDGIRVVPLQDKPEFEETPGIRDALIFNAKKFRPEVLIVENKNVFALQQALPEYEIMTFHRLLRTVQKNPSVLDHYL